VIAIKTVKVKWCPNCKQYVALVQHVCPTTLEKPENLSPSLLKIP
jgi:hypothetical protein